MKKIERLFVHSGSLHQAQVIFDLIALLDKLQVIRVQELVDARPYNLTMGAT
jgi:hypothetical protein